MAITQEPAAKKAKTELKRYQCWAGMLYDVCVVLALDTGAHANICDSDELLKQWISEPSPSNSKDRITGRPRDTPHFQNNYVRWCRGGVEDWTFDSPLSLLELGVLMEGKGENICEIQESLGLYPNTAMNPKSHYSRIFGIVKHLSDDEVKMLKAYHGLTGDQTLMDFLSQQDLDDPAFIGHFLPGL
jgi:hypothetical protein